MAKGYWLGHTKIHDPEGYKAYQAANAKAFAKYDAKFLVRGGQQTVVEGDAMNRSVVIEFPSYAAALACYESPEYAEAKALRDGISDIDLVIVEGYEG